MTRLGEAAIDAARETGSEAGGLPRRRVRVAGLEEARRAKLWMRLRTGSDYGVSLAEPEPLVRKVTRYGGKTLYEVRHADGSVEYRDTPPPAEPDPQNRLLEEALRENGYPVAAKDICIPLGTTACFGRDEAPGESDVEVVHVVPVRFLESEGTRLGHLRPGYLYVFVDGHLWRELRVDTEENHDLRRIGSWMYYEVDLARYQGRDVRPCSAANAQRGILALPRKIEGKTPKIEVAWSEVQWPWSYICRLGGLAEDDPRYLPDYPPNRRHAGIEVDDALRRSRLQSIDLAGYVHAEKSEEEIRTGYLLPLSQAARENNPEPDGTLETQLRQTLPLLLPPYNDADYAIAHAKLPVLVLHDPLGVADGLYEDFAYEYLRHADWMEEYGPAGAPEPGPSGENQTMGQFKHPPANRYRKVLLARYVTAIVDANSSLKEKDLVDYTGAKAELDYFEQERQRQEQAIEERAGALVAFLEGDGPVPALPLPIDSVAAALLDYGIGPGMQAQAGSERAGEGMQRYADLLQWLNQTGVGHDFLVRQLETEDSLTRHVLAAGMTDALASAIESEDGGQPLPTLLPGQNPADRAWLATVRDTYGITRTVWSALVDLHETLARAQRVVMAGRRATLVSRSGSVQGELKRLLRLFTALYGEPVGVTALSRRQLQAALSIREAGDRGPLVLNIEAELPNGDETVHVLTLRDEPVFSRRLEKLLVDGYPAKVMMALQAIGIAIAWQEVVEGGLGSELEVLHLLQVAFETLNAAANAGQMAYQISARRTALLARANLMRGSLAGTGDLSRALMAGKVLGGVAIMAGIGASALGMVRDMELAREADVKSLEFVKKEYEESANINKYSMVTGVVGLGAVLTAPFSATAAIVVGVITGLAEVGLFFKQLVLQEEIARIRPDSPLEYWLHGSYWGTDPYGIRDTDPSGDIDYALLRDKPEREVELLQQILFACEARLVWVDEAYRTGRPRRLRTRQICVDALLPNPGTKEARVYVELKLYLRDGSERTLLAEGLPVHEQETGMAPLPRGVRLFRIQGQAPSALDTKRTPESDAGRTVRVQFGEELLPEHIEKVSARVAFDPAGIRNPVIPDEENGIALMLLRDLESYRAGWQDEAASLTVYRGGFPRS